MTLEETIQNLKESIKNAPNKLEYEKYKQDSLQLLVWLESYKTISESYPEVKKKMYRLEEENMRLLWSALRIGKRCETLEAEIKRLQDVSSWIPCSDRMPDDDVDVLVYDDGILIARYNSNEEYTSGWMESFECYPLTNATHWMPLPAPPEVINNVD